MKKIIPIVAVLATVSTMPVYNANAWGPERSTFTMESPAPYATFNSITNNPTIGDERNFVRIAEKGSYGIFEDEITIEPNKEYEVYIGYHNDAASNLNETGVGIAQQVKLSSMFPPTLKAGERGMVSATISAYDTNPGSVWDEAYITASTDLTLSYVAGSAIIYNDWGINGSVLSTNLFSEGGTYLGVDKLDGIVYGCAEYSGHIIYRISTSTEVKPDIPSELPETGPAEIIMATVIILGIGVGGFYFYRSKKTLNKVMGSIGKAPENNENNTEVVNQEETPDKDQN